MRTKQNGGLLWREKQARQLSTCWLNHGTIEPSNQKSQIAQEYGLLPANARQQLARHQAPQWKKGETAKTKNVGTRSEPRGGLGRATTASVADFSFSPFSHTAEPGPRLGVYETRNQRHEMGPWGVPIYVLDSYMPPDSFWKSRSLSRVLFFSLLAWGSWCDP